MVAGRWRVLLVLGVGAACARDNPAFDPTRDGKSTGGATHGTTAFGGDAADTATDAGADAATDATAGTSPSLDTDPVATSSGPPDATSGDTGPVVGRCPNGETVLDYRVTIDTFLVDIGGCPGGCADMNYGAAESQTLAGTDGDTAYLLLKFDVPATEVVAANLTVTADVSNLAPAAATLSVWTFDDACDWIEGTGPGIVQPEIDGTPTYNNCWFPDGDWPGGIVDTAKLEVLGSRTPPAGDGQPLVWELDPTLTSAWLLGGGRSLLVAVEGLGPNVVSLLARESGMVPTLTVTTCNQ